MAVPMNNYNTPAKNIAINVVHEMLKVERLQDISLFFDWISRPY